jgi:hypothetical protein
VHCKKIITGSNVFGGIKCEKMTNVNITGLNKGLGQKIK